MKPEPTSRALLVDGLPLVAALMTVGLILLPVAGNANPDYGREPAYSKTNSSSIYLKMTDGTDLAVDVHLPKRLAPGQRIPAIVHQTRYWRSLDIRFPFSLWIDGRFVLWAAYRRYFVTRGYAWVDVDVRGTGASFGTWKHSYWSKEIEDGREVVDWIVAQPWSSGKVGAWGVSYAGGAAEFLLVNKHPAVKAAVPMFSPFDVYDEIAFPGGIRARWYIGRWASINARLDRNDPPVDAWHQRLAVRGVRPVDGRDGRLRLKEALARRGANVDVEAESRHIEFRDDVSPRIGGIDLMSPHAHVLQTAGVPVYSYSGWFDGAYQHGAIRRFLTLSNPHSRLIIGPWDHGGAHNVSLGTPAQFDHRAEILKFFDFHLLELPTGIDREPRVRFYTMGSEVWQTAQTWPPPGMRSLRLHLSSDSRLTETQQKTDGSDDHTVDAGLGTGSLSRWTALLGATDSSTLYPRQERFSNRALSYMTAPLSEPLEVTGHPMISLQISTDGSNASVFAVLEEVDRQGRVRYVTEGSLNARHRGSITATAPYRDVVPVRVYDRTRSAPLVPNEVTELLVDLLPTSYQFRAGHAIRLSIASVDGDYFDSVSDGAVLRIHWGPTNPSVLILPVR